MANLRYSDKHNMVAFLKKPTKSVGFTEIVDFIKGTSLRYALTHNSTIYDSLVKQFWQTATVRSLANGIQELVTSIDNKEYTITEASIRSKLQLAYATGISILSDAEIYEGLATLGGELVPLLPAMLAGAAEDQGEGSANPAEPNPHLLIQQDTEIPQSQGPTITHVADEATTTRVGVETEGATTTTSGLDAGLDSGNIHESPLRSHEAPLHEGHTSGSAEDSLQLKELMVLVPKLVTRIDNLEKELHHTKNTYGKAVLTLVERVKSLEVALKRKTKKVVVSDSEYEETENQGRKIQDIDDDPLVSLVRESMKEADFVTPTKDSASGEAQEEEISPTILEAAKTLSQVASQTVSTYKRRVRSTDKGKDISTGLDAEAEVNTGSEDFNPDSIEVNTGSAPVSTPSVVQTVNVVIPSLVKSQREGKAPMTTEETQATKRTKAQIQQEKAGFAEAMRLKALQDEEAARQVHFDALLAKRILEEQYLQGESVTDDDFAKRMVEMINQKKKYYAKQKAKEKRSKPMTHAQQRYYMSTFIKNQSSWKLTQLKKLTFEELKIEFEKLLEQEFSKKQKIIEKVPIIEECATESMIVKEEEIEKPVKKRGKIKKQKARKGIHVDKTAQDEIEEEREAFMKDKVTSASSESEIGIDAIPTAIKPPSIVDWKIIPQTGQKAVYEIIRSDGSYKVYMSLGAILKYFSRDNLTGLYRLVIKKYGVNTPEEMYDRVLWGDLKTMFDLPLSDDVIWGLPLQQKMINWR
ncbi:hypothetical protein Tco_0558480 [Tanacetum coccineum]